MRRIITGIPVSVVATAGLAAVFLLLAACGSAMGPSKTYKLGQRVTIDYPEEWGVMEVDNGKEVYFIKEYYKDNLGQIQLPYDLHLSIEEGKLVDMKSIARDWTEIEVDGHRAIRCTPQDRADVTLGELAMGWLVLVALDDDTVVRISADSNQHFWNENEQEKLFEAMLNSVRLN
jgi:hypothetical protein